MIAMNLKNIVSWRDIFVLFSVIVEPIYELVKDIFDLDRCCWISNNSSNCWFFAAMSIVVQMHKLTAFEEKRRTWIIKNEILG
jgi:hypothetical protein